MRPAERLCVSRAAPPEALAKIERDLDAITRATRDALGDSLEALVLVGGYARSEGGVIRTATGWQAHNDYDLIASVTGSMRVARRKLSEVARACTERVGVDVDLWPVRPALLDAPPATLFWLDCALGSARILHGRRDRLAHLDLSVRALPLEEGSRLLANRAVGVALSRLAAVSGEAASGQPHDASHDASHDAPNDASPIVVARHVHKAVLAAGDALLIAADAYGPSVAVRADAIADLADAPSIGDPLAVAYRDAAAFRLRPDLWRAPAGVSFDAWVTSTLAHVARAHLAFESWRLGRAIDLASFVRAKTPIFTDLRDTRRLGGWVSWARARRDGVPLPSPRTTSPRERLARAATGLAYGDAHVGAEALALLGIAPAVADVRNADVAREARRRLRALASIAG